MVRSEPGIGTTSILTVGDSVGGYRMVGIPDGLGAYDNGDGTFTTPFLGDGAYLLDMQVHAASSDPELVEGGQYMDLHIPPGRRF
jgi:hypothetical protein